jgi:vacuolar-type H+-ATPase subunit E/Vma4
MTLSALLEAIQASGDSQARKIEMQAYTKCCEILANTRLEAEQVEAESHAKSVEPAFKERARILQRARLEALQILGSAREEFVDSTFAQIRTQLAETRTKKSYPQILQRLTEEALAELKESMKSSGTVQLEADPKDRLVLEGILQDIGLDYSVKYVLDCWGGLIAKCENGRVVVINTLEARLERATPYLRCYLAALFENTDAEIEISQISERQLVSI